MKAQRNASPAFDVRHTEEHGFAIDAVVPEPRTSFIYFVATHEGDVKVGFSINPGKRFVNLQISHPRQLEFIGVITGSRDDEQKLHAQLAKYHLRGEWFSAKIRPLVDWLIEHHNS